MKHDPFKKPLHQEKKRKKKNILKFNPPSLSEVMCYLKTLAGKLFLLLISNCFLKSFEPESLREKKGGKERKQKCSLEMRSKTDLDIQI